MTKKLCLKSILYSLFFITPHIFKNLDIKNFINTNITHTVTRYSSLPILVDSETK